MNQTKRNILAGVLIALGYPLKLCFWGLILGFVATVCLIVGLIISAILPEGDYPPSTALIEYPGNGRYEICIMASQETVFDTETNERHSIVSDTALTDVFEYRFFDTYFEKHGFTSIPVYSKETGKMERLDCFVTVLTFDYHGNQLKKTVGEEAYLPQEAELFAIEYKQVPAFLRGIAELDHFVISNAERAHRGEYRLDLQQLNSLERRLYDHVKAEAVGREADGVYWTETSCRRDGEKIYVYASFYNKRMGIWNQHPSLRGLCGTILLEYDQHTDTFTELLRLEKGCSILACDATNVFFYEDGAIYHLNYRTGERKHLLDCPDSTPSVTATPNDARIYVLDEENTSIRHATRFSYDGLLLGELEE